MVGIVGVVGLFALFGYAGLQVAQKAKDSYGKLLVAGLTSLILVQATINLFAVMGLAPLTGVPLPFVSYGNSSLLATLFAVGLILNVARGGRGARLDAALANCASSRAGARPRRERSRSSGAKSSQESWWRRGEPRATSCRPWRSPPSFGLAAPRSPSSARASGSRPSWCPAAGYEIDFLKVRGIDRRNPLRAAARRRRGARRGRRGAAGAARAAAPTWSWAAAASSPGPAGPGGGARAARRWS